ncbi:MAG: hypothetical protein ACT4NL_10970 [Pseudomarimonas sp.]
MSKANLEFEPDSQGGGVVRIQLNDRDVLQKQATLILQLKARVKDSRPVHDSRVLHQQSLELSAMSMTADIPAGSLDRVYSYHGKGLDVLPELRLVIDDGILFDSSVDHACDLPSLTRPKVTHDASEMMDPKDAFNFIANLSAIPYRNRMITLALALVGGVIVIGNMVIGVHDQFVSEAQILFYDHRGSDGSESPFMKALAGSGAMGAGIWAAIMVQLRKYMTFALKPHTSPQRGKPLAARDLIDGVARVDLHDITVKVVACNREAGQYKRGSGTKERTVSFKNATRAVLLYERYIALVPARVPLAMYLEGDIDFEPMFGDLYPPLEVSSTHGLSVAWEVQLLHPKFVDHELEGEVGGLRFADFVDA